MRAAKALAASLSFSSMASLCAQPVPSREGGLSLRSSSGLELYVTENNSQPSLRIVLPGHASSDTSIVVLFPEHVTAIGHGDEAAERLYVFRPGIQGERPAWRRAGNSLEYQRELPGSVRLIARATLEEDGVRFHYTFVSRSTQAYDMIYAVTDPRLTSIFHDRRLERTFVHHADGFDLLASETPSRLTLPLNRWLPARYLASFRWPIPDRRVEQREDGITYYNKSRAVDEPFIATRSSDGAWVVASFTRETGNVWSNPELTCQHVDPQVALRPSEQATIELKMLILRGSVSDAFQRAREQRLKMK